MEITKNSFYETMEEVLYDDRYSNNITESEMRGYLKEIKKFIKHAKVGDTYNYAGNEYIVIE